MANQTWLKVEDGDAAGALRAFLSALLDAGHLDALLAPCRVGEGGAVAHVLVEDARALARCAPLAPAMPANAAALVSRLTIQDTGRRLGVLLRSCELRALVELVKLHQIGLEHVTTIGVDCLGTYELVDYVEMWRAGARPDAIWEGAAGGRPALVEGQQIRVACQMCEHPAAELADIRIGLIGLDPSRQILIESDDALELPAGMLGEGTPAEAKRRQEAAARLAGERAEERDRRLSAWEDEVRDIPALLDRFAACIRCHNCMIACPICYCKECIFRTPTFDHDPDQYFRWAERKGALRMPADTLLFHLTRLNHMATSCIGCGMCDSACPSRLPVATMFRAVARRVQALFDYEAGRSLDEEVPLATFCEDELRDLGK